MSVPFYVFGSIVLHHAALFVVPHRAALFWDLGRLLLLDLLFLG